MHPPARWYDIAQRSLWLSQPNPRVGCWLVSRTGQVFEGHTQQAGGAHAEAHAIAQARQAGVDLRGATAYVTLEPCSHHGRTPPCADAMVEAGIGHVVIACIDPNPLVAGRGVQRLQAAGIEVQVLDERHPAAIATRELNIGFFSRMIRGRPWVRAKAAVSLDGRTALADGSSQWITGEQARADGHRWRARACAVLTGVGTVRDDDPRLDVRLEGITRQPHLAVVDSRLETPPTARLFDKAAGHLQRKVWLYHAQPEESPRQPALVERGAQLIALPGPGNKVDLRELMTDLAAREINELHVEAGHRLNGSLWREGLIDEWLIYQAPTLLGETARGLLAWPGPTDLGAAPSMEFRDLLACGPDLRLLARVKGSDAFLHHSR